MEAHQFNNDFNTEHKQNTKASPLVTVEKVVNAPAKKVFNAWVDEALLKEWWGPKGLTCPTAKVDFRLGGKYLFCMTGEGHEIWSTGTYLEIVPNKKIVCSDNPSNSKGDIITPEDAPEGPFADLGESYMTVEFEALSDHKCKMTLYHEGLPARMHDECVEGWSSSLDKLKRLVEAH